MALWAPRGDVSFGTLRGDARGGLSPWLCGAASSGLTPGGTASNLPLPPPAALLPRLLALNEEWDDIGRETGGGRWPHGVGSSH